MRQRTLTIAGALALALVVSACAGDSADEATTTSSPGSEQTTTTSTGESTTTAAVETTTTAGPTDEASITIENFSFTGARTVAVGTMVTVTNQDGVSHTWTSKDDVWSSGGISGGESFEFTFEEPGEYEYFCSIHPTMEGTITVEG